MTQNEKDILLKDLCARVPYGVKFKHEGRRTIGKILSIAPKRTYTSVVYFDDAINHPKECDMDDIKPYLFPLSSMTEEQKREFDISMDMGYAAAYNAEINCANRMIDFFHKHHIDYRGLIPMGLAEDATGKNIY
jgi:hypothetical protein